MDASEAMRRVLDGEPRAEVKDARGRVIATYFRKGEQVYVNDEDGERPIIVLPEQSKRRDH